MSKAKPASLSYTLKSILWAMIGVRRGKGHEEDAARITPMQAIMVGLIAVVTFVMTIYFVVRLVIGLAAG